MAVTAKLERMDLRISPEDKETLELAANLNHLSLSSYILSICLKQAELDIQKNEIIRLDNRERDALMSLLNDDSEPNQALKELMR